MSRIPVLNVAIATGALIASAAAVFIAWDQARTARVQRDASVLPAIQIDAYVENPDPEEASALHIGFRIENAGSGPAFVKTASLRDGGEPVSGYEHLANLLPGGMRLEAEQLTGRVIAPGVERDALRMTWRPETLGPDTVRKAHVATGGLSLEICYCSTLDKCWVSRSGDRVRPRGVAACPAADEGLF